METPGYLYGLPSSDFFHIDDLLDFSNEEVFGPLTDTVTTATSTISMTETTENRPSNDGSLHRNFADGQDPTELCVPSDDLAELEWLSNFVEESFSAVGFSFPSGADGSVNTNFRPETSVPGRARSKRSRAAVHNWTSRIMTHSPSSSTDSDLPQMGMLPETGKVTAKTGKKKEIPSGSASEQFPGRKCTHCCTEKTPQWRTGPMGPKTLCNACGVRYKSGRLVPEYRPAASPTFVLTQHSNSHRKVMELRRQKEIRQENREFFIHDRQQDFKVY